MRYVYRIYTYTIISVWNAQLDHYKYCTKLTNIREMCMGRGSRGGTDKL